MMLLFWRWKQIYAGPSVMECDQICNALSEAGVKYSREVKVGHYVFPMGSDTGGRMMGNAVMEPPEVSTTYYVYVRRSDEGRAKYLMYRR